ncbi:hypothetical protein GCM10010271_66270 [Streptomyces kurssanovii]|nr:hypothetical protein GCM10010271_66270 [Streptomyces kurssanovii]
MPAAGIAEEQVTGEAGGGAVHEDSVGTHGISDPRGGVRRTGLYRGRACEKSSLRVRALVRRDRR